MSSSSLELRLLSGFEDSRLTAGVWDELLSQGRADVVFMSWHWQKAWWDTFGRGKLLLILAERQSRPVAVAPLFSDGGMIYLVGSGGSDYLDVVGNVCDSEALDDMLTLAIKESPGFIGICFYHILESSDTHRQLAEIARRRGWVCCQEGELAAPVMGLKEFPEQAAQAPRKKSLLRHEAFFAREGKLKVEHFCAPEDIAPHMDSFFAQHIARWDATPHQSLFKNPQQCLFYRRLCADAARTGWLRFTRVSWNERPISYHFGFSYKGSFLWYKPSFEISLARRSPGEVLLRQLFLRAQAEGAHTFDFGLGEEPFKKRFATGARIVRSWGVYPPSSIKKA